MSVQGPQYDPKLICEIAQKGNVHLEKNAKKDSVNLEYFEEDLVSCLCNIRLEHYYKTLPYTLKNGTEIFFDVYKLQCMNSKDRSDELYIKLRVTAQNWLLVGSFKLK